MLTVKELLNPRYKVIADYPCSHETIGEIINANPVGWSDSERHYNKYPHIFKKLEWWEERYENEMPPYVKGNIKQIKGVFEVPKWINEKGEYYFVNKEPHVGIAAKNTLPATKEEYEQYKLSLQL